MGRYRIQARPISHHHSGFMGSISAQSHHSHPTSHHQRCSFITAASSKSTITICLNSCWPSSWSGVLASMEAKNSLPPLPSTSYKVEFVSIPKETPTDRMSHHNLHVLQEWFPQASMQFTKQSFHTLLYSKPPHNRGIRCFKYSY